MLCRKCGAELPNGADKCKYCGAKLSETVEAAVEEAFNEDEDRRQRQIDKMTEDKQKQLSEIQQRRDSKRAKQKRNKIALAAVGCAAVIAVAGAGVHYYNEYQNEIDESLSVSPSPVVQATALAVSPSPLVSASPDTSASPAADSGSWTATGNTGSTRAADSSAAAGAGASGTSGGTSAGSSSASGSASSGGAGSGGSSASAGSSAQASGTAASAGASASGISRNNISAQLATGGEVIEDNGNWYMTFVSGNTKYYANVNPGATTDQVRNMTYTITAVPTDVTYNGNTVYEITSMTKYNGVDYILPNSGTKLLNSADLKGLSKDDLALARNEIYARHGRKFTTAEYQRYFSSKLWYQENPNYNYNDDNSNLNEIEIKNVEFIIDAENK